MNDSEQVKNKKTKSAWTIAQEILARREYSEYELSNKLVKKGYPNHEVEEVLSELQQRGWQSDERFCESYVRFRTQKGQGPLKIQYELSQKKVDPQIIANVLQMYDAQWVQLCENVLHKKYGSATEITFEEKAKRLRFLTSRGFPSEIIRQII